MRNFIYWFFLGMVLIVGQENLIQAQTPAFPGAEGFGSLATGGRGGDVYHVTTLDDEDLGSLRYGIDNAEGPLTIVFDVSGNIILKKGLRLERSNITLAGQTAPGDGITLSGYPFYISGNNVIIRYMRFRLGDKNGVVSDAISINGGTNIIVDHITASWSVDETFSCQSNSADSITIQWCMISESLRKSHHNKGPHGYGGILGSSTQSVHHNIYAHHTSRTPKVTGRRHCLVDFRNNVIYNWGFNNCYDGTASYMNWANNYYKAGPGTSKKVQKQIFNLNDKQIDSGGNNSPEDSEKYETSLYAEGNYMHGYPEVTADNWNGGVHFSEGASESKNRAQTPFEFPPITEQTAEEAYHLVLAKAGASLKRDAIDNRIVQEISSGTASFGEGGIIDSQSQVGGLPELNSLPAPADSDRDGMPDAWERANKLDPSNPADGNWDQDKDGYTNLEEYLASIVAR